jgi:hypothetical protein
MPHNVLQQIPPPASPITPAEALLRQLTGQGTSVDALQVQVSQLSEQLVALRAQRDVLGARMGGKARNGARAELEAQRAQLDAQITQVDMQLQAAKAQIGARVGVQSYEVGSNGKVNISRRGVDPDMVIGLSFLLAICVALPISLASARRIWRGKSKDVPVRADESPQRMERLEHAVDAIAIEIERVAEGQRFVTKILAERPAQASTSVRAPQGDANDAALGDAKPFLALGAGPVEPIRVAERQAVKQSITPH